MHCCRYWRRGAKRVCLIGGFTGIPATCRPAFSVCSSIQPSPTETPGPCQMVGSKAPCKCAWKASSDQPGAETSKIFRSGIRKSDWRSQTLIIVRWKSKANAYGMISRCFFSRATAYYFTHLKIISFLPDPRLDDAYVESQIFGLSPPFCSVIGFGKADDSISFNS